MSLALCHPAARFQALAAAKTAQQEHMRTAATPPRVQHALLVTGPLQKQPVVTCAQPAHNRQLQAVFLALLGLLLHLAQQTAPRAHLDGSWRQMARLSAQCVHPGLTRTQQELLVAHLVLRAHSQQHQAQVHALHALRTITKPMLVKPLAAPAPQAHIQHKLAHQARASAFHK